MTNEKELKIRASGSDVGKKKYIGTYVLLALAVLFVLMPLYIVFATSIMSKYEANGSAFKFWPEQVSFESYHRLLFEQVGGYSLIRSFFNTILYYLPSTIVGVLVSSMSAFAFARMRFRIKSFMFSTLMLTMLVPNTMGLITAYLLYDTIGWIGTPLPIIVPALFGSIGSTFFLRQFYMKMPDDLVGCAKLDGLGWFGIYFRIMLPISIPAIVAQFILVFIAGYNDYMGPLLYLPEASQATLQIALAQIQDPRIQNWPLRMAGCVIAMTPLLVMYLISQKYVLKGVSVSAGFKG